MIDEQFNNSNIIRSLTRKLSVVKSKLENLEEKFIEDQFDFDAYKRWKQKYQEEISDHENKISLVRKYKNIIQDKKAGILVKLNDLYKLFHSANTPQKIALIKNWFDMNLTYNGELYRTNFIPPLSRLKT